MKEKLHLCVGFYGDGSFKTNTVKDSNLSSNIQYNAIYRPGRMYFVDGTYVCGGGLKEPFKTQKIQQLTEKLKEMNLQPKDNDTAPYV